MASNNSINNTLFSPTIDNPTITNLVDPTSAQTPATKHYVDQAIPAGVTTGFAGISAPTGWLLCYGQAVSRITYANLWAALHASATFTITIASPGVATQTGHGLRTGDQVYLSTTGALPTGLTAGTQYFAHVIDANTFHLSTSQANAYGGTYINTSGSQSGTHTNTYAPWGIGDGSTTFNIPDHRGRGFSGKDDMGGTAASRLTLDTTQGVRGFNLGNTGGEQSHVIVTAEMASHTHSFNVAAVGAGGGGGQIVGGSTPFSTTSVGSDSAHNNMQPTVIQNVIIKT